MLKNIIYSIWHIIAGFGLVYFIIPSAELWILILFTAGFASLREHIQKIRKTHKNSINAFNMYKDVIEWVIGAIIFWVLRQHNILKPDNI